MYSTLGYFRFKNGHCTNTWSAKYNKILPDKDKDLVLQKLSTKTIFVCTMNVQCKAKDAIHIGMQVPGPLHRIKSGLILKIIGIL